MNSTIAVERPTIPDHVPPHLVKPIDWTNDPEMDVCPHAMMAKLHQGPRIFFNPNDRCPDGSNGYWVPTRAEDIRTLLNSTDVFSNRKIAQFSRLMGETWDLLPVEVDPPDHQKYRSVLNKMFGPGQVRGMQGWIDEHCNALMDKFIDRGACEFVEEFAAPFPVLIVMDLLGIDRALFPETLKGAHGLFNGATIEDRMKGASDLGKIMWAHIREKQKTPKEDVISRLIQTEIDGRPMNDQEIMGMSFLLFGGGIHTATATLGFQFKYMAENPEIQANLRANPESITAAIEETMRAFTVVHSFRRVVKDTTLGGAELKAGDWVRNTLPVANYDPAEFSNPEELNLCRANNRHVAFGFGPHFCVGMHLARQEMNTAWANWLRRVPPFRIGKGGSKVHSALLLDVEKLHLEW
ncbi:cytochrome P450 [Paracoccus pantotrophus]|uniref:cytochrome P450 n=1 Tax=Paracoccus pantotrophus TaxID=82367 RepID=UPI00048E27F7|nr:cytochrome P450 [Paracoccus pantotrophus]